MTKKRAIVTVGVSCSGKTSWANEFIQEHQNWKIVCRDDIRTMLYNDVKENYHPFTWDKWDWSLETNVTSIQYNTIKELANNNDVEGIIIADTNLNSIHRDTLYNYLISMGFAVNYMYFHVSWEDAIRRNNIRSNGVSLSVIAKQFEMYQQMFARHYVPIDDLPLAIMVNLDGTLAVNVTNRNKFDTVRFVEDELNDQIAFILNAYKEKNYKILLLTERSELTSEITEQWLMDKLTWLPDKIYYRVNNDVRNIATIKSEIFWEKLAYHYNVKLAIDNNPSVIRNWLEYNIKTLICGNPYMEEK